SVPDPLRYNNNGQFGESCGSAFAQAEARRVWAQEKQARKTRTHLGDSAFDD
ncbi:MAG: hypothetical protein JWP48_5665, partial [Actinoallomurus sp.]|nr:hypothetical protein [Actinoallomurus sp.]